MLRIPAQRKQRQKALQSQGIESAQALSVKDNFDYPE
jgi:hypothetical protein